MTDVFRRLGLRRVINVSGTETERGGAPVCAEAIAAVSELAPHSVQMLELQAAASRVIARAYGCDAGCVTGCTAGSIGIAVAAAMTGRDLGLVEQLPDTNGMKDEVIVPKAHVVSYGHDVTQNIRVAGAKVVEIGFSTELSRYQIEHAIGPQTAAAVFVVSHLTPQHKITDLKAFAEICHPHDVPVIVDAASQANPRVFLDDGADLVLFSSQKALASLTGGVIAGKKDLVHACLYQQHGIGRPMKPGKEAVAATIAAIERWENTDWSAEGRALIRRMEFTVNQLSSLPGVMARIVKSQVFVEVDRDAAGVSASEIARVLLDSDPMIVVWDHHAPEGELRLSLKLADDEQTSAVSERIAEVIQRGPAKCRAKQLREGPGERMARELAAWPGG